VIAERRADLSPEVYIRAERQFGNDTVSNTAQGNRVFIGLSSRFGAGLSSLSGIAGAKSQHQAALAEVEVQRLSVSEQVLADYALATSLESRLDPLKASMDAAGEVAKSYDRQFLAGRKSWLDVMNAARELAQTETQLADIQSAQIIATWRLAIYTKGLATVAGGAQ
jgi:adhesin transport system outer membrane protein